MVYFVHAKAMMKTWQNVRSSERLRLVKRSCYRCILHTTSEPSVGNGRTGAPVKASMSGKACLATRVEPWNTLYPTPDFIRGWDYFYCSPVAKHFSPLTGSMTVRLHFESLEIHKVFLRLLKFALQSYPSLIG